MNPITIDVLVTPSEIDGEYVVHTAYGFLGEGTSIERAKETAQDCVINYLWAYAQQDKPFPLPSIDLSTKSPRKLIDDGKIEREPKDGLPKLIFKYFR